MSKKVKKVCVNSFICFGLTSFIYLCCDKFLSVKLPFTVNVSLFILFYILYFKECFLKVSVEINN